MAVLSRKILRQATQNHIPAINQDKNQGAVVDYQIW
jgi:hypothetical protein